MTRALTLAALLGTPALALAHDLWVERVGDAFVVRAGHRGGARVPLDPAQVKAVRCLDAGGALHERRAAATFTADEARFPGPCAAASVFLDGGFWSLTPDGEVNAPRTRAAQVIRSWASRRYAKWVDARGPRQAAVLGDELELVPVTDLANARTGGKITLRVLSAGAPVPGAMVAVGHHAVGETDSRGEIRLRVRAARVESIAASVRRPRVTPEAESEVLEASLTFEVAR